MEVNAEVYQLIGMFIDVLSWCIGLWINCKNSAPQNNAKNHRDFSSRESCWIKYSSVRINNSIEVNVLNAGWTIERK